MLRPRVPLLVGLACLGSIAIPNCIAAPNPVSCPLTPAVPLRIDGLGKGIAPLNGPWQFHLGDNPTWALPQTLDTGGVNGWEQLTADIPWGAQGHRSYTGYAWYRKHLSFTFAPDVSANVYLLIPQLQDVDEVYWNGRIVGHEGAMPPHPQVRFHIESQPAQIVNLGPAREGVLAVRVWAKPFTSFDNGVEGGFGSLPSAGGLAGVESEKATLDYKWLRSHQFYFGLVTLYALMMFLSLLTWLHNRTQRVLLAMAAFTASPVLALFLGNLRLPLSYNFVLGWLQPVLCMQDVGLWFLLLYLLELDRNPRIARSTRIVAIVLFTASSLDGLLLMLDWSRPGLTVPAQSIDGVLTVITTTLEVMSPLVLVGFAVHKRLDFARWFLAISAFLSEMTMVLRIAFAQGSRFTHWTLGEKLSSPLFTINGNRFAPQDLAGSLLFIAAIFAVYRYMQTTLRHQGSLEQELKSARELQQVLIPGTLPELPGFAVTSSYRPAQEVGGDFFQIIPLEGECAGSTLVVVGDVSGKGLRAAMTVSLIVGTVRTLARFTPQPAELLFELNQRLCGRMQGGFTTCIAMLLDADGRCTIASAGHPAPFLGAHEVLLSGELPLGIEPGHIYSERPIELREGDCLVLYTDGLLEARSANGEIFGFERLHTLIATQPGAAEASDAAVGFGQNDDITVLTLTRLSHGEQPTTELTVRELASA
jgi:Stage II sporulation protein E (SpoIIE)